jgi:hypothetical protein
MQWARRVFRPTIRVVARERLRPTRRGKGKVVGFWLYLINNVSPITNHQSLHPKPPLNNQRSPIVPTGDRLSRDIAQRVLFTSLSLYEMEIFNPFRNRVDRL